MDMQIKSQVQYILYGVLALLTVILVGVGFDAGYLGLGWLQALLPFLYIEGNLLELKFRALIVGAGLMTAWVLLVALHAVTDSPGAQKRLLNLQLLVKAGFFGVAIVVVLASWQHTLSRQAGPDMLALMVVSIAGTLLGICLIMIVFGTARDGFEAAFDPTPREMLDDFLRANPVLMFSMMFTAMCADAGRQVRVNQVLVELVTSNPPYTVILMTMMGICITAAVGMQVLILKSQRQAGDPASTSVVSAGA